MRRAWNRLPISAWTDDVLEAEEELKRSTLSDLEEAFGPMRVDLANLTVDVDWPYDAPHYPEPRPPPSAETVRRRANVQKPLKPRPPPENYSDPVVLGRIVDSLRHQLAEHHNVHACFVQAHFVKLYLDRIGWVVLQFTMVNQNHEPLWIILDGSGPGRAAWVLRATSAEQAVTRIAGQVFESGVGIPHAEGQ